jgi:hypothetical protein
MKFKRIILFSVSILASLIVGIYIGNGYALSIQRSHIAKKLNTCTQNLERIDWPSLISISHYLDKKSLSIVYVNKSECFNFESITSKLIIYKNGISDTTLITLKETVRAKNKLAINIQQPNADSVIILQSTINQKSLNF